MTVEEKRRELFEEWLSAQACHGVFMGGYTNEEEEGAWAAFNAALDAVVIHLPSPYPSVFYGAEEFADGIEECREFINDHNPLGLKVLP